MLFRRFALGGHTAHTSAAAAWGLATIVGLMSTSGCRTPWRAVGDQPDFNRLIEIERQQSGSRSPQPDAFSARPRSAAQRPGTQYPSAQYASAQYPSAQRESAYEDEWNEPQDGGPSGPAGKYAASAPKARGSDGPGPSAAHGSLSDQDSMEDMLLDVPAAQRDLLRREMSALRARGAESGSADSAPASSSRASRRFSDDDQSTQQLGDNANGDNPNYAGNSKYQLAANDTSRHGAVPPRAVEGAATRSLSDSPAAGRRSSPPDNRSTSQLANNNNNNDNNSLTGRPPQATAASRRVADNSAAEHQPADHLSADRLSADHPSQSAPQANPVVSASYTGSSQPNPAPTAAPSNSVAGSVAGSADKQDLSWREHIYHALEKLEQSPDAASPEEQVHRAMVDRLLHLSLGDINAASEPIEGLQNHGQDFVRHSLESLYEVANPAGNPVEVKRYTLAMLSQRKALSHLAAVSNLEVQNATFCTEVDGFGVVSKFPQYNFKPDQELLLYCELDNFVSTHKEGQGYETQLQGSYEIVDVSGRRIADQLLPMDSHICRNQRRDYFIAYRIYMPQKIDPGKYQLKLTVEDLKGRKFGQSALDFQIAQ